MASRQARFQQQLKQLAIDNAQSEDEFVELEIKVKIREQRQGTKTQRISQELLSEAFRWRLSRNDCQNRGYVLDGYPCSYATANQVFVITPEAPKKPEIKQDEDGNDIPPEEPEIDEEALAELMKPKFQKHIYPDSVIYIRGSNEYLHKRARSMDESANTKWDIENLERRLCKFNEANDLNLFLAANNHPDLGLPTHKAGVLPITRFYQENKTEVFEIDTDGNVFEMFESMRVYIERNGRPYNYLSSVPSLNQKRAEHLTEEEK